MKKWNSPIKETVKSYFIRTWDIKRDSEYLLKEQQVKFRFIKHHKFKFTVKKMCKVLKVSISGYYNWLNAKVLKLWLYN